MQLFCGSHLLSIYQYNRVFKTNKIKKKKNWEAELRIITNLTVFRERP